MYQKHTYRQMCASIRFKKKRQNCIFELKLNVICNPYYLLTPRVLFLFFFFLCFSFFFFRIAICRVLFEASDCNCYWKLDYDRIWICFFFSCFFENNYAENTLLQIFSVDLERISKHELIDSNWTHVQIHVNRID